MKKLMIENFNFLVNDFSFKLVQKAKINHIIYENKLVLIEISNDGLDGIISIMISKYVDNKNTNFPNQENLVFDFLDYLTIRKINFSENICKMPIDLEKISTLSNLLKNELQHILLNMDDILKKIKIIQDKRKEDYLKKRR